jgi:signal transduction histidine kinase
VPQDISRVMLNLYNNAFYAVSEKMKEQIHGYVPTVSVTTKRNANYIKIIVSDKGTGIPHKIIDQIF